MVGFLVRFRSAIPLKRPSGRKERCDPQNILHYLMYSDERHNIPFVPSYPPLSGPCEQIVEYSTIFIVRLLLWYNAGR